ncbi:hypothetical protein J6590_055604 [Homalodisca vitripennis]|nr:hypothetical protein J6590_055604 [Homalodisca vitripennis]
MRFTSGGPVIEYLLPAFTGISPEVQDTPMRVTICRGVAEQGSSKSLVQLHRKTHLVARSTSLPDPPRWPFHLVARPTSLPDPPRCPTHDPPGT